MFALVFPFLTYDIKCCESFVLLLDPPLEAQQSIKELTGRIEHLEKDMLLLKSYGQSGLMTW